MTPTTNSRLETLQAIAAAEVRGEMRGLEKAHIALIDFLEAHSFADLSEDEALSLEHKMLKCIYDLRAAGLGP